MPSSFLHNQPKMHALILAFPQQGHLTPLLHLSHHLSHNGFLITFLIPQHLASHLHSLPALSHHHFRTLIVPCADGHPDIVHQFREMEAMHQPVERLIPQLQQQSPPLSCIISDVFVTWSHLLASKFCLPLVAFFTANATTCGVFAHTPQLVSKGILPFNNGISHIDCIPGVPPLLPSDFPRSMQSQDFSDNSFQFALRIFERIHQASGLLINTFYELETRIIDELERMVPVYPVGPLLLSSGDEPSTTHLQVSFRQEEEQCLNWLDSCSPSSVLYAAFGSRSTLSEAQVTELALGLESSYQSFLWAIHPDAIPRPASKVLPEGFLDRTKDRSMIVPWAPQLHVLSHPAIGGFLSHCGWNSTIENLSLAGVPMLCWPHVADQKLTCRLLVDEWKIGVEFERKEDGMVDRVVVEQAVRGVMQGDNSRELRRRARELKDLGRKAMEEGGSSWKKMDAFVKMMERKSMIQQNP